MAPAWTFAYTRRYTLLGVLVKVPQPLLSVFPLRSLVSQRPELSTWYRSTGSLAYAAPVSDQTKQKLVAVAACAGVAVLAKPARLAAAARAMRVRRTD